MLYKVSEDTVESAERVNFSDVEISELNVENWVEKEPKILGEPLMIIGRQFEVEEVGDRLDLLALDKQGNLVIIELKSNVIRSEASLQAVKYASYLSNWQLEEIERQMGQYLEGDHDVIKDIEEFCEEDYEINDQQRIILAGGDVRPRTSSVTLWLRKQGVDIKIVQLEPWQDDEDIYLNPRVLIPLPAEEKFNIQALAEDKSKPWKEDGKDWHLNNRCSKDSAELLHSLIELIEESLAGVQGPNWRQKFYVSFKIHGSNWIYIRTQASTLRVQVSCNLADFDTKQIAEKLNMKAMKPDTGFDRELSNEVKKWTEKSRIVFRLRTDFEIDEKFAEILEDMKRSFEREVL